MSTFTLPDLGEGLQEAEIVSWHVSVGDHVVADQPLLSVETDKAVVEIPAPQAGVITALHGKPGDIVRIGAPLAEFDGEDMRDTGAIVGTLPKREEPKPAEPNRPGAARAGKATPAVRAQAKRLGIDVASMTGTGPDGAITAADVKRAAGEERGESAAVPLRGVRRAMAVNMEKSGAEVVPATVTDEADVHDWADGTDITMRLVRAIATACQAQPALNAWYLGRDDGRRLHDHVDLGIAMDTEDGLFVPVLRDVGGRDADDLRSGLDAMRADVKARTVPAEELRGQTITLSNFGMFGGRHAALVVVPPQVAIIGAGKIYEDVVGRGGKPAVRRMLPLSLTFDHRGVSGGEAARFLAALKGDLEKTD
jgi:pyruvate dehydrogenase E2 component (dihydrolipoamide acetyltransferase)